MKLNSYNYGKIRLAVFKSKIDTALWLNVYVLFVGLFVGLFVLKIFNKGAYI